MQNVGSGAGFELCAVSSVDIVLATHSGLSVVWVMFDPHSSERRSFRPELICVAENEILTFVIKKQTHPRAVPTIDELRNTLYTRIPTIDELRNTLYTVEYPLLKNYGTPCICIYDSPISTCGNIVCFPVVTSSCIYSCFLFLLCVLRCCGCC